MTSDNSLPPLVDRILPGAPDPNSTFDGFEILEVTSRSKWSEKVEIGWYWFAYNEPRVGLWLVGPYQNREDAIEDAVVKALPFEDPRRDQVFDGILEGAKVKHAWGQRGTADTALK